MCCSRQAINRSYVNLEFKILNSKLLLRIPTYATVFVEIPLLFHLVEVDGVWLVVVLLWFFVALDEFDLNGSV